MGTPGPLEPADISAILKEAGFPLSNYGLEATEWDRPTSGYTAWKTHQPDGVFIAVQYTPRHLFSDHADVRVHLAEYATVLRAAGYAPVIRDRGEDLPWLMIPAGTKEEGRR